MERKNKKNRLIYIAGYGRSGSTILDIVLSNAANGVTLGEISNVFNELNGVTDGYYAVILEDTLKELSLSREEVKELKLSDRIGSAFSPNYKSFWDAFFKNLTKNQEVHFFIDSSKTTWHSLFRPFNLRKSGFDINIIFLKAPYPKVWKSALKGSNKFLQNANTTKKKHYLFAVKSVFSKLLVDLFTNIIYSKKKYNLVRINYEDFIMDPLSTVRKISEQLKIDFINLDDKIKRNEFYVKGGYLGNRLRKKGSYIQIKKNA